MTDAASLFTTMMKEPRSYKRMLHQRARHVLLWFVLMLTLLGSAACTEPLFIVYPPGARSQGAQPPAAPAAFSAQAQAEPGQALAMAGPTTAPAVTQTSPALSTAAPATPTALPPTPTDTATTVPSTSTATAKPPTATATPLVATATVTRAPAKALPSATPTTRRTRPAARPTATPTPAWPKELVITEKDIEAAAAGDAVPGLQVQGLDVQLGNNTMTISFDSLRYGFVSLRNVTVQGHFEVVNGDVNFVADRIQPRNLATATIPGFVNQALDQSLAGWYVESLSIRPGALVAKVRPR